MNRFRAVSCAAAVLALASAAAAVAGVAGIHTTNVRLDVFRGDRSVGRMRLEVMTVGSLAVIDEDFTATFRTAGETADAGFKSQIVYKGAATPNPTRGEVTTHIADFKLMTGKVTFSQAEDTWTADAEATGFADIQRHPFPTARSWSESLSTTGRLLLTHGAFLYFAPRLLPKAGKIEDVTLVEFPDNIAFPKMLTFQTGCVLQRSPAGADGKAGIALQRVFPGGNVRPLLTMTVNKAGKVLEMKLGRMKDGTFKYTLRPPAADATE